MVCFEKNIDQQYLFINHRYNKILKAIWLSAVLILALIG